MELQLVKKKITRQQLKKIAEKGFGNMLKIVVDIRKEIMTVGGELHADGEKILLDKGSSSNDLWGANLYLDKPKKEWIEFLALINIRPSQGNRDMEIQNKSLKAKIKNIVNKLIQD